ncbi:MAG: ferredoxin [Dehalococcoidia bacterium]|nr:ferredoxin [Dehalococcoidia bacterium]
MLKVRVDRNVCIAASNCMAVAPTVFELDGSKTAVVLDAGSVSEDKLWEAAESCPVGAIVLEDDKGKQLYP